MLAPQPGVTIVQGPAQVVESMATYPTLVRSPSPVSQLPLGHSQSQVLVGRDHSPGATVLRSGRGSGPPPPVSVQQQRDSSPGNFLLHVTVEHGNGHGREMSPQPGQSRASAKYFDLSEWDMQVPVPNSDVEGVGLRHSASWAQCSRSPSPTSFSNPNCAVQVAPPDGSIKLDTSTDPLQRSGQLLQKTGRVVTSHPKLNILDIEGSPAFLALRQHVEGQLRQQRDLVSALASQWEQRFLQFEQGLKAVNEGLKASTTMATTMNERSAKFLKLGEVLEKLTAERQEAQSFSESVQTLQDDVAKIGQELTIEKAERLKLVEDVCCQAEGQVAAINKLVEAEKKRMCSDEDSLHTIASSVAGCFSADNSEKLLQLSRDSAQMREQLDATSDHLMRLAKQVGMVQQEVWQCTFNQTGPEEELGKEAPGSWKLSPRPSVDDSRRDMSGKRTVSSTNCTAARSSQSTSPSLTDIKGNSLG